MTRPRPIVLLAAAGFALSLGVNMHVAMNVNFLHEILHATSWQQGYLESIRETCGILSILVITLLAGRSEPRVAAVMLAMTGAGLALYNRIGSIPVLILCSLTWSFGFHAFVPLTGSMQLALAPRGREGRTIGIMGAVGAAGVLLGLACVYGFRVWAGMGMRDLFLLGGAVVMLGAIPLLFLPEVVAPRMTWHSIARFLQPRYRLYCGLELMDGMRKQIFILFATLAMVQEHGVKVETLAALMFANQVLNLGLGPAAGHLVDRVGERPVLMAYFTGLVAVFLLYTLLHSLIALYAVYMFDSALWSLRVGVTTYAKRIARAGEQTRLLAMGVTMNHVGAVTLPLVGAALYSRYGYRLPFYCGAVIAAGSIFIAQALPVRVSVAERRTGPAARPAH